MSPRITVIHAVHGAMSPAREAFSEVWPEAELTHLLDDGLPGALKRAGTLTQPIAQRIRDLATYAARAGADGILFTCSAFTPAMDEARKDVRIPVHKPDEAMFREAIEVGHRIGVVATFSDAMQVAEPQIRKIAADRSISAQIRSKVVTDAFGADRETHDRLVAAAAAELAPQVDVICLAQFSMAASRAAVQARVGALIPVLTSPIEAVKRLRADPHFRESAVVDDRGPQRARPGLPAGTA